MSFKSPRDDEDDPDNLYSILGISSNATESQIRSAYKHLSKSFHPDKHPENLELTSALFKKINKAYTGIEYS
ncbi:Chaperone protein DnaJ [Neolecta irregularis DAH-3]|uniref:Chaperone protein DnaJ n=1 Tax=Neolecta irregularis (strain DAH-3) TaxID=1198029 RepID=A0A1U7LQ79_NEOID|nr:Chaperone protein DnaJ [Neolecta irregularis DAH-3]|eukprot:OLL24702.1 Chaperone protein DnaJ [Neolecta irregularis DAH-3]